MKKSPKARWWSCTAKLEVVFWIVGISLSYNFFHGELLTDIFFLQTPCCRQMFWSDNRTWHLLFPKFKTRFEPSISFYFLIFVYRRTVIAEASFFNFFLLCCFCQHLAVNEHFNTDEFGYRLIWKQSVRISTQRLLLVMHAVRYLWICM